MNELALIPIATVPLNPIITDFLRLRDKLIAPGVAMDSTPRVIIIIIRAAARTRMVIVGGGGGGEGVVPLRRRRSVWRRGLQFSVEIGTREAIALACPPMVADLLVLWVAGTRAGQPLEHALATPSVHIH